LCKSGHAVNGASWPLATCTEAPKFTGASRKMQYAQTDCTYSVGGTEIKIASTCGFNQTGTSYCPVLGGDLTDTDFANFDALFASNAACSNQHSILNQFAFRCKDLSEKAKTDEKIKAALTTIYYLQSQSSYAYIQDNPSCIKNAVVANVNLFHEFIAHDGAHTYQSTTEEFLA
jgi:hypothetical protein